MRFLELIRRFQPNGGAVALVVGIGPAACGTTAATLDTAPGGAATTSAPRPTTWDPPPDLPSVARTGSSEEALIVLKPPTDVTAVRDVVRVFFRAVAKESSADLAALFEGRSRFWTGRQSRRESLQATWNRRLKELDYTTLEGRVIYRESALQIYRAVEANELRLERNLPLSAREDEILVRARIVTPAPAGVPLFGDQIVFLLRPSDNGYKIGEIHEDFRLP